MIKASEAFPGPDSDGQVRGIKAWLKSKGVKDFEPVSLYCDQLTKETVAEIEALCDTITTNSSGSIKKAIVKGIPRQAVLKPSHVVYRLQNQRFELGDRVTMVQDSGGVPLSVKGVVVGLNAKSMDVVWDVPFMSGVTLGNRCSQYRGSTVEFNTCLNLTNPQFVTSTNPKAPPPVHNNAPFKPRFGQYPAITPAPGQTAASGFRPAPPPVNSNQPVHIMVNPNRGGAWRGRGYVNGRGGPPPPSSATQAPTTTTHVDSVSSGSGGVLPSHHHSHRGGVVTRGGGRGGRGGFDYASRGLDFSPRGDHHHRGRARGGLRGRGRGSFALAS